MSLFEVFGGTRSGLLPVLLFLSLLEKLVGELEEDDDDDDDVTAVDCTTVDDCTGAAVAFVATIVAGVAPAIAPPLWVFVLFVRGETLGVSLLAWLVMAKCAPPFLCCSFCFCNF